MMILIKLNIEVPTIDAFAESANIVQIKGAANVKNRRAVALSRMHTVNIEYEVWFTNMVFYDETIFY